MFDLFGGGDSGFDAERGRLYDAKRKYENLDLPALQKLALEAYNPETANYTTNKGDAETKSMQLSALKRLAGLAESGMSDEDALAYDKARSVGGQLAKQGTEAAIANAQARGVGGGGMEFAMREMANQGGAQRAHEAALEQAANSARQRAMYNQAYSSALGGFRNQNNQEEAGNTDIINRFNQINTGARNQAGMYNIEGRAQNTRANNAIEQQRYGNRTGQIDKVNGINKDINAVDSAEQARRKKQQGAGLGMIGGAVGAIYGGPAGASAGYGIGSSLGENM